MEDRPEKFNCRCDIQPFTNCDVRPFMSAISEASRDAAVRYEQARADYRFDEIVAREFGDAG